MTNEDLGALAAGALSALEVGGRSIHRYHPVASHYTHVNCNDDLVELPGSAFDAAITGLQRMIAAIKVDLAYERGRRTNA